METMKFKNPTETSINLGPIGLGIVEPGDEVDIPLDLCAPNRMSSGARGKSSLENCAPQLIPVVAHESKVWKATPSEPTPVSKIVTVSRPVVVIEAPGVKALREAKAAKELAKPILKDDTKK